MLPLLKVDEVFSLKEPELNKALIFSLVSSIFLGNKTGVSKTAERGRIKGRKLVTEILVMVKEALKRVGFFSVSVRMIQFGWAPCEL